MIRTIKYRLYLWWRNINEDLVQVWGLDSDEAVVLENDDGEVWQLD